MSSSARWHSSTTAQPPDPSGSAVELLQPSVTAESTANEAQAGLTRPSTLSAPPGEPLERETELPGLMQLTIIMFTICLDVFCVALDNTVVSTAIPRISDELHSFGDIGWYGSAYLLTSCAFQLLYGKLYSFFSTKWTFVASLVLFEVGSAISGAAPTSVALIMGRAIAGLGTGGVLNGSMLIIASIAPLSRRPTLTGILGSMYGMASVLGPLLGGAFSTNVSWRWCFYINLPLGGVTIVVITLFYRAKSGTKPRELEPGLRAKLQQFDVLGTIVFIPMIVCLVLALQWGGLEYLWSSDRVIAVLVVFAVLLPTFIGIQIRARNDATVPPRLIRQRSVASAFFFRLAVGSAHFMVSYYLPTWFQVIKGVSTVDSGVRSLSLVLSLVIASVVGGFLISKLGYYNPFMILTSILTSIGAGLLSTLHIHSGPGMWIGYPIISGAGAGLGTQQSILIVQTVLEPPDIPTGTALLIFAQTLGGAIFISVGQNILQSRLITGLQDVIPNPKSILEGGATAIDSLASTDQAQRVRQIYNSALVHVFYTAAAMAAVSLLGAIGLEWRKVRSKKELMAEVARKRMMLQQARQCTEHP